MPYQPPDGIPRSADEELRLNEAVAHIFNSKPGEVVLRWLRSVTIERVAGPGQVDGQYLAHMEGQRYVVGLIEQRIGFGKARQPEVPRETPTTGSKPGRRPGRSRTGQ